ncbi:hypothetical protein AIT98_004422 [Salmonella enterica subsp. indica]|uniref:Uncharacterized protein n=1 Tax=Salmonella enterica TaxID=28901 RepID=A0A701ZI67_SALER|nr:hypothetical protein [Salmonella enterica]HAC6576998.1 hypothetical protein [Salmonella enterica subsp. indica]HBC0062982.1 hypothetical protein [Salmonella enterica]HCL5303512.1 hypothetical protein [Salmonella enterica]
MPISLTAGSPKCNCKNPDTCTHALKITTTVPEETYEYKQGESLPVIYLHDRDAEGVDVTTTLIGKTCVSSSPDCPSGVIYNDYYLSQLKKGQNNNKLKYLSYEEKLKLTMEGANSVNIKTPGSGYIYEALEYLDIVTFLTDVVFEGIEKIDKTEYALQVGECLGQPIQEMIFPLKTTANDRAKYPIYTTVDTRIVVYPKLVWEVNINISSSKNDGTKELTDDERYDIIQGRTQNDQMSVGKYAITRGVTINGSASIEVGNANKDYKKTIEKEFTRYKDKLTLLRNAEKTINTVTNLFKADDKKIQLLSIDIKYPSLNIKGSGELLLRKDNKPYVKCGVDVNLDPLIQFTITLDLIQAFAAYFHQERNIARIREKAQSQEGDVKSGKNGAYAKVVLNLIVSGNINLSYRYAADDNNEFHSELGDKNEGRLGLSLESKIEAGLRLVIIEAFFSAEAKISAECCFALDKKQKKDLELIFYHNGIVMYAEYKIKVSIGDSSEDQSADADKKNTESNNSWEEGEGEWTLCKPLSKEASPYKLIF